MNTIKVSIKDKTAIIGLDRGKSNAINAEMVAEMHQMIRNVENDDTIGGLIITGKEGFFSAGLDLIELYDYDENKIRQFWSDFLDFVTALTSFKKPLISAISGHSPAGGCVLAICSDYRIMAEGKYIIGLNEVPVGIIVPDSIFHLYSFWLGNARAYQFLLEGKLLGCEEALKFGLVDEVVNPLSLMSVAEKKMQTYLQHDRTTWQQSKVNLRKELLVRVGADQSESLEIMLKQWWAPSTRSILKTIIQNLQKK
ncbi:enoyl-CoA hydratase/isomerase family protein [Daejeonella oryzae]|uniref:enoyl-CoA hydratase/isomerase family protein n=1 Tax=Daejeonella oryzae TaxID=1122943 RepID=UPI0004017F0E|nr:enoyl-CoA hydratase/isomerase family protein [Daejeonella oryzae]